MCSLISWLPTFCFVTREMAEGCAPHRQGKCFYLLSASKPLLAASNFLLAASNFLLGASQGIASRKQLFACRKHALLAAGKCLPAARSISAASTMNRAHRWLPPGKSCFPVQTRICLETVALPAWGHPR